MLTFQKLDVYQAAIDFIRHTARIGTRLPKGQADLFDQLQRAAQSVPLNLAEGSGKFNRDAKRFYAIARGSALECAAVLDVIEAMSLMDAADLTEARTLLKRVVEMASALLRK